MKFCKVGLWVLLATAVQGNAAAEQAKQPEIRAASLPNLLIERSHSQPFVTDELKFELAPAKSPGWRLEYIVDMKAGDAMLYSLVATAPVISEFHGEINANKAVMFYREDAATTAAHGQLIAPADGGHGWYIANTTDKPVTVTLRLSGRYEKTPGLVKISK